MKKGNAIAIADRRRRDVRTVIVNSMNLEDHNRMLQGVIEAIADAVFVKDMQGRYTIINTAGAAMLDRKPEEVIGKDDRAFFSAEVADQIMRDDRKVMTTGEPTQTEEIDLIGGESKVFSSTKSALRDHLGAIVGMVGVSREITGKRRAEDDVRRSEDRFRTLFEQAPFSVQLISPTGRTLQVNRAWRELWRIPDEVVRDFILKEYDIFNDPQLIKKDIVKYFHTALAGESTPIPAILYDPAEIGKPGRPRWVSAFVHPIKESDGSVREIVLIHEDVTERREHESERERLVAKLQNAVRAREEFLSIASHELKTPLTALKLQAQIRWRYLARGNMKAFEPDNLARMIDTDVGQIERLGRLVDDMLDISRVVHGKLRIDPKAEDLGKIVRNVAERFSDQIEEGASALLISVEEGITGSWDRYRIEQVVTNLLTNAMKYGKGRSIDVMVRSDEGRAHIVVRDQGMGIAPEDHARIFERFERAVSANEISGLGLGLYISREIAQAHGGTISVDSAPGRGSTFTVTLPLVAGAF